MYFSSSFLYPETDTLLDHTMYFGKIKEDYKKDILAIYAFMNSSLSGLYPDLYGRNYGGGATGFMIYEMQKLPVPDPKILRNYYPPIKEIMNKMEKRKINTVFEEIWNGEGDFNMSKVKPDRLLLDRLILRAIGFSSPDKFLESWYRSIIKIVSERLTKAESQKKSKISSKENLSKIADNIIKSIKIKRFPDDYITNIKIEKTINLEDTTNLRYGKDINGFFLKTDNETLYFDSSWGSWTNCVVSLETTEQVDKEFLGWLKESYEIHGNK